MHAHNYVHACNTMVYGITRYTMEDVYMLCVCACVCVCACIHVCVRKWGRGGGGGEGGVIRELLFIICSP